MGKAELLIEEDITKYKGNWVAIYDKRVIAHGREMIKVHENALKLQPDNNFFIHYIPEKFYPMIMKSGSLDAVVAE